MSQSACQVCARIRSYLEPVGVMVSLGAQLV